MSNYELDEEKEYTSNTLLNNSKNELYDEDAHIPHPLIRVSRVSLPNNGENWEISEDDRVMLTLKGLRLTQKQRSFLRTPSGISWLMSEYKLGTRTVVALKEKMKGVLRD